MPQLLDLPHELLWMILDHLPIRDLRTLDGTCEQLHDIIQFDHYDWLEKFYSYGKPGDPNAVKKVLQRTNSLILSQFLLSRLISHFRYSNKLPQDLDPLYEQGASLVHIREPHEVNKLFSCAQDLTTLKYILEHGAVIAAFPGGMNSLLEYHLRSLVHGWDCAEYLIGLGASLTDVPSGLDLLADSHAYLSGDTELLRKLLAHGAKLGTLPDGIQGLFQKAVECCGVNGQGAQYLLTLGGSFDDLPGGIDESLEETLRKFGPGEEVDFLLAHGASLDRIGGERGVYGVFLEMLGCKEWNLDQDDDESDTSSYGSNNARSMESAMYLLQHSSLATRHGGLAGMLEQLWRNFGPFGPLADVLEEDLIGENDLSLEDVPSGLDALLAETQDDFGAEGILFLLDRGASLDALSCSPEELLLRLFTENGTKEAMWILEKYQASFDPFDTEEPSVLSIGDYLLKRHSSALAQLPGGPPQLMQDLYLAFHSRGVRWLEAKLSVSPLDMPCGLPYALAQRVAASTEDDREWLGKYLLKEFDRFERDLDPGQLGSLMDAFARKFGYHPVLDRLLALDATFDDIHSLLQVETLSSSRRLLSETLVNLDFLHKHGAKVEKMPRGADKVLEEVIDRYEDGPRTQWLLKHGAPREPFEDWKARKGIAKAMKENGPRRKKKEPAS